MESLAGKELQHSGAVHAYQLDGKGGVTPIGEQDVVNSEKPCWLHLDSTLPASVRWLNKTTLVPDSVRNALAGKAPAPESRVWVKVR